MRNHPIAAVCGFLLSATAFASDRLPPPQVEADAPPVHAELRLLTLAENPVGFEGEATSLSLATPEAVSAQATFTMSGLPDGFMIDAATGEINGTFGAKDAGQHLVTVRARTETRTERLTFTWIVLDKTLPAIESPGLKVSRAQDAVEMPVIAAEPDGDTLRFMAFGLPKGLTIDPATGTISGQIGPHELRTTYTVTLVARGGHVSGGTVFTWVVLPFDS